eukprot:10543067-Lingulodinium_polyedra.AAC.1
MSALVTSASVLREVIVSAIRVAIRDPALLQHILATLSTERALPSVSTLRRHRLALHMGFCLWQQDLAKTFLSQDGGP